MKNALVSLFLAAFVAAAGPVLATELGIIRLSLMEGDVQVLIQDTTDWTPATINLPLNEHDRLWVPDDGRVELQVQGGVLVRAGDGSGLDVLTVSRDSAQFYLDRGHLYINNRKGGIAAVQVDTGMASVRTYDNTIMMLDVSEDGTSEVSVLKGSATVESKAGATQVTAGSTLTIRGETTKESEREGERWHIKERRFGSFQRSISLPNNVDADQVGAQYADGVLTLTVPKSEQAKPRKISVSSSGQRNGQQTIEGQTRPRNGQQMSEGQAQQRKGR
jgi:hypothetical protein